MARQRLTGGTGLTMSRNQVAADEEISVTRTFQSVPLPRPRLGLWHVPDCTCQTRHRYVSRNL